MSQKALAVVSEAAVADTAASANTVVMRDATGGIAVATLSASAVQSSGTIAGTVTAKSASFTAAAATDYVVDCTGGAVTVTLPLASASVGVKYTFTKKDASGNAITVSGVSGTGTVSSQYGRVTVFSDGSAWWSA